MIKKTILISLYSFFAFSLLAQNPVCSFQYKKTIIIQGSQISGGPHTNMPVLISHTDADLATVAGKVTNVNGFDIVFADDNGILLDFQLELYDGATGQYVAWVRIPTLVNGTDVTIHMLYGKATITTNQSTTNVWDVNYQSVWHLSNNSFADGTVNGNTATNSATTNNAGSKIGGGRSSTASGEYVQVPTTGMSTASGTMSIWGNASSFAGGGAHRYYFGHTTSPAYNNRLQLYMADGTGGELRLGLGDVHTRATGIQMLNLSQWYYFTVTWDGVNYEVYVDGISRATGTYTGLGSFNTLVDMGNNGNILSRTEAFDGTLDELRISNVVRSANWIATEYTSQNTPLGTFYLLGVEEDIFHTSISAGDWDVAGIWDNAEVPSGQFENVVIAHDVDIDVGSADYTICDCFINGTGTQLANLDVMDTRVLTVKGDLDATYSGTGASSSRVRLSNSAIINVERDMTWLHSNTNIAGGLHLEIYNTALLNLTGDFSMTHTSGNDCGVSLNGDGRFNVAGNMSLVKNGGDLSSFYMDDNAITDITGDMTIDQNGGNNFQVYLNNLSGNAAQMNIAGNATLTHDGGANYYLVIDDDNTLFHVGGNFSLTTTGGGSTYIMLDNNGTFDVDGNYVSNHTGGGNFYIDMDGGTDLSTFNVGGHFSLTNIGVARCFLDLNGGIFQVDSNFTVLNSSVNTGDDIDIFVDEGAIMNVGGNMFATLTGGDDIEVWLGASSTNSVAQLNVTGNATFTSSNTSSGRRMSIRVYDDTRFTVGGNLSLIHMLAAAGLNIYFDAQNTSRTTVTGNVILSAQSSGDVEIELLNTSELQIAGNFIRGTFPNKFGTLHSATTATVEYNGTSATQIFSEDAGSGGDEFVYGIVEVNNTFITTPQLTLEGVATMFGGIVFVDGIVQSTAANLLIVANNATSSGASDISFVDGPVRKTGDDAFVFPVGKNDTAYAPISISAPALTTDHFTGEYFQVSPATIPYDRSLRDPSLDHVSNCEYWILDRTNGTANVSVTLSWDDRSCGVTNLSTLAVARWDGVSWKDHGNNGAPTGNVNIGTVTSSAAVTNFSPFTLASTDPGNPLPVELISFNATLNEDQVDLSWTTASEINNDYFEIEKSNDAQLFQYVLTVDGNGNSNQIIEYFDIDYEATEGTTYYRLKQVDFDGTISYSNIVPVKYILEGIQAVINLLPNPTQEGGVLRIELEGFKNKNVLLILRDIQGKEFYTKSIKVIETNYQMEAIQLDSSIPAGTYLVIAASDDKLISKKLVIK